MSGVRRAVTSVGLCPGSGVARRGPGGGAAAAAWSLRFVPGHSCSFAGLLFGSAPRSGGGDRRGAGGNGVGEGLPADRGEDRSAGGHGAGMVTSVQVDSEGDQSAFHGVGVSPRPVAGPDPPGRLAPGGRGGGDRYGSSGGVVAFGCAPGVGVGGGDERRLAVGNTSSPLAGAVIGGDPARNLSVGGRERGAHADD